MKPDERVLVWPFGLVTTTLTEPAAWAGVMAVIEELELTETLVAWEPPRERVAPDEKLEPETVTEVPPLEEPELGEIELITGPGVGGGTPPDFGNIVLSFFVAPGGVFK